ncbi:retrotransposon protein, putative, ty1-copia subclass [Tanacetum coccineum]
MPELTSHGGTMAASLRHQRRDTICGGDKSGEASVGIQEKESLAYVWRKRMGHISEAGLHELERIKVFGNKGLCKLKFYENYVLGKLTRSPSSALEKNTPMDLCSGHLKNYEMLRIFGCIAYSHRNQGKLKPRAIKCIFLGYPDGNMVELNVDPYTGENPGNEDEEQDDEEPQQQNLDNYVLVHDRVKISTTIPTRRSVTIQSKADSSGFIQRTGIEYNEVFSPVVRHTYIKVILSLTACEDYELEQLDVKTIFSHDNLEETIYMWHPLVLKKERATKFGFFGVATSRASLKCFRFHNRNLFMVLSNPLVVVQRFDVYTVSYEFSCSSYDSCVYYKEFAPEFDMKELSPTRKILGMEIVKDRVFVPLGAHFKVSLSKISYENVVGSLMYFMVCTRPDISYDVSIVSRDQGKHVDVDGFVDSD